MPKGRYLSVLTIAITVILISAGCSGSSKSSSSPETTSTTANAVTVYPGSPSVSVNQTINFTAFLPSSPSSTFTWSVTGGGSIVSTTGVYTAPSSVPSSTVTVTATSTASSSMTGTATINIASAQGVAVSPAALAVKAGGVQVFTANGAAVTGWNVNGTPGGDSVHGTISSNGTYIAPPVPPPGGSTTITAVTASGSGTATATILFSNSSLNGSYAYSYTGNNLSGFLAVAGSFTAQGSSGNISNGLEEAAGPGSATQSQFTGTFAVNPDGSATATLSNGAVWQLALVSNQQGTAVQESPLIRFDKNASGSGTINLQNPVFLSASAFSGNYVFGLFGPDASGRPLAMAGRFFSDGVGTIPALGAEQDINYYGVTSTFSTSAASDTSLQGSFFLDPVHGNINGNGTVTLTSTDTIFTSTTTISTTTTTTSLQFAFFIVDNTHIKVIETDKNFALAGDFYSAANAPAVGAFTAGTALPPGKYAFTLNGQSSAGAYALGGVLTSNTTSTTAGSITGGVVDVNDGAFNIQLANSVNGSTYTFDASFGRVALPLMVKGQATINCVLYRAAYNTAAGPAELFEMIEVDNNVAAGIAYPQTSPASLSGNYTFNLAGVANAGSNAVKQDFIGQLTAIGNSSFQGTLNGNNFGQASLSPNVPLTTGSTIQATDANGRGTLTITSNSATFPLAYYVSDNGVLLLETDLARVATGSLNKQF